MIRTSDHVHLTSGLYTNFEGKGRVLRQGDGGYEIGDENDLGLVNREAGNGVWEMVSRYPKLSII